MIGFSRLQNISRRGVNTSSNREGEHLRPTRIQIQGSFAESIAIDGNSDLGVEDDCDSDASSCSSSSEEELSPHIHSSQQGSFPSCPPSVEQKNSGLVIPMPLPVVFEEDECESIVSNIDKEEEEGRKEKVLEENTSSLHVDFQGNSTEAVSEQENDCPNSASKLKSDNIESCFYSSAKTVCSSADVTISLSQDSTSEVSTDITSTKSMEDELDSRLNAILALKEVVFTQRTTIKETTKDKKRLISKIAERDKINNRVSQRNKDLEKELASMRELLRAATLKLSNKGQELEQTAVRLNFEEPDDESTINQGREETIFERLHRENEERKKRISRKAGKSDA